MINLYFGPVINPISLTDYAALPHCLIAVGLDGNILWIEEVIDPSILHNTITTRGLKDGEYNLIDHSASPGNFIMPGLIDTHVHACQFPNLGIGGDLELPEWLFRYVYPTEKKFVDKSYAERVYNDVIDRSIASGTTTSCYYGTVHLEATVILADVVWKKGQRAFVGKCNMDYDSPDDYIEQSAEASLEDTKKLIEHVLGLPLSLFNERLVHPIITPRFALSCSKRLLTELGDLAKSLPHVPIQTHVSENRDEVRNALERFGADSYTEIYYQFGLLRQNTILGHGVWLTEKEMELIASQGAGVAHCPTSNFYLGSGMARVGLLLDHGVKVGLGTDVGGGYNPSILYTIQMASTTSKMVVLQSELEEECRQQRYQYHKYGKHGKHARHDRHSKDTDQEPTLDSALDVEAIEHRKHDKNGHHGHHGHHFPHHPQHECPIPIAKRPFAQKKLGVETLLYLATLGGANVCCLQDRIGSFAVGKAFDAIYVSLDNTAGNPAIWGEGVDEQEKERTEKNLRRWLERFLFCGDNRNIRRVFVQGVQIGGADTKKGN